MNWKKILPVIGIGILIYLLFKINLANIGRELMNANLPLLLIALGMVFFVMIVQTFKWFIVAKKQKINDSYG